MGQNTTLGYRIFDPNVSHSKEMVQSTGSIDLLSGPHPHGPSMATPFTKPSQSILVEQEKTVHQNTSRFNVQTCNHMVAKPSQCNDWSALDSPPSRSDHLHGQFGYWLGRNPGQPESLRQVGPDLCHGTYKSQRIDGRLENYSPLPTSALRQKHISGQRQYVNSLLLEQTRRDQVTKTSGPNSENLAMVSGPQYPPQSQAHPGEVQCHQRSVVSPRPDHNNRMVNSPQCDRSNQQNMGEPINRPLCNQIQSQTASVFLPSSGQPGSSSGCHVSRLEQSNSICLSSSGSTTTSAKQNKRPAVHSISDSSGVELEILVSEPPKPPRRQTQKNHSTPKTSQTAPKRNISQKPRPVRPSRLEVIRQRLQAKGFSPRSAKSISERCRGSTNRLYEIKWQKYTRWCDQRKIDHFNITEQQMSDFFTYLAEDQKLSVSALQGYRAVINSTIKICTTKDICNNFYLHSQFRSYRHQQSMVKDRVPKWNLNLVLNSLTKPPYEPIIDSSLKFLTWKTTFLTAYATAARVSELTALSRKKVAHDRNWSKMSLTTHKNFIAKNQDLTIDSSPRQFEIPALYDFAGPDLPDRLLCPVRAMRYYLHKSDQIRTKEKKQLFISHSKKKKGEITSNTVSNWIKQVIKLAYKNSKDEDLNLAHVRAHETRALAASTAFAHNLALKDINRACYWRSDSTFTSYYLRDIAMHQNGEINLPNVVAASFKITK